MKWRFDEDPSCISKLISSSKSNIIINKRRDVYGLEREECDIILKNFKKEDK